MSAKYVVIIPYFSEEEIDRYLLIADRIGEFGQQNCDYEYLLAASPRIAPSNRLYQGFAKLAPTRHFACPSQVFGYPQGPTAMFWDCMDHLAKLECDGGFGLWLESDMVPVKPNWLEHIVDEWEQADNPLMMGCYVPEVIKKRFIRRQRVWITEHANGGGCYARNFGTVMPASYREGTFDVVCYEYLKDNNLFAATRSLAFSTVDRCRHDMADPTKMILHGFMQDKDRFVDQCLRPLAEHEQQFRQLSPQAAARQDFLKRISLRFFKRGLPAMLDALTMEQEMLWRTDQISDISVAGRSANALASTKSVKRAA